MSYKVQGTALIVWLGIGLCLVGLYGFNGNAEETMAYGRSMILWLQSRWSYAGSDMSHGWLIPFVSLWLVWRQRDQVRNVASEGDWRASGLVLLSLLMYLAGIRVQQTRIVLMSLPLLLLGIAWFMHGGGVARKIAFPCAYLLFCVPFTFLDALTLPLRLISTSVASGVLNGLGVQVIRMGTAIHVGGDGGFSLDVAHPCSGLRYLIAMAALTAVYAYVTQKGAVRRWALGLASLPIAMVANVVRIILIALVGVIWDKDVAVGFYHDYSGYVVFGVAIVLMISLGNALVRWGRPLPEATA